MLPLRGEGWAHSEDLASNRGSDPDGVCCGADRLWILAVWILAVWICFEKDLKFLAIELLVAVLIPIPEVGCGAQPKSPFHEGDFAVAVEVPALQG